MKISYNKEISNIIIKPILNDVNCLVSLLRHKLLKADLIIFKVVLKKWFQRFHTSKISRRFNLINSRMNQLIKMNLDEIYLTIMSSFISEKFDAVTGKIEYPTFDNILSLMNLSINACEVLNKIHRDIISVFEDCFLWIKLGHFARQMRIMTAVVSRLSLFFKTIMIKICDIYPYLYNYLEIINYSKLKLIEPKKEIFFYLQKVNVELPKTKKLTNDNNKNNDVGQKLLREFFDQTLKNNKDEGEISLNDKEDFLKIENLEIKKTNKVESHKKLTVIKTVDNSYNTIKKNKLSLCNIDDKIEEIKKLNEKKELKIRKEIRKKKQTEKHKKIKKTNLKLKKIFYLKNQILSLKFKKKLKKI